MTTEMDEIAAWLSQRCVNEDGQWGKAWSDRAGMEWVSVRFDPLPYHSAWSVIVGLHASGTNPRMCIGRCKTLTEVKMVYHTMSLINGYPEAEQADE